MISQAITQILIILFCLFMIFGTVCIVYGYDSSDSKAVYEQAEKDSQALDIQYQLIEIKEQLEQQRIQDQLDRLYDNCGYDCDCW